MPRTAAALAALCAAVVIVLAAPSQASAAWKLRFVAGFNHGLNTNIWTRYNGTPRCCHNTRWRRSHVVVRGGLSGSRTTATPRSATTGCRAACRWGGR